MKTSNFILIAGLTGGLFAATAAFATGIPGTNGVPLDASAAPANMGKGPPPPGAAATSATTPATTPAETPEASPAPDDQATPPAEAVTPPADLTVSMPDTNTVVDAVTGEIKLRMNFHNAPLDAVAKYMSMAAGFIIHPKVSLSGKVTVWNDQPMTKDEALSLFKQLLSENGYTAIPEGVNDRVLTIISSDKAKTSDIPVISGNIATNIQKNFDIVTQIIPVRSLNAVKKKLVCTEE